MTELRSAELWTIQPHGLFRVRVLLALIRHHWFIRLRWVFVSLAAVLLLVEQLTLTSVTRPRMIWGAVASVALVNLIWTAVGRRLRNGLNNGARGAADAVRSVVWFVNAQMVVDIFLLTALLRYSGGVENPMAVFYLFHMLIAALLLKPFNALLQGVWALGLFAGLGAAECVGWIDPHYSFLSAVGTTTLHTDPLYITATVGVVAAGVVGTLYFTLQISSRLDEQEAELFRMNKALRRSRGDIEHLQEKRSRFLRTATHQLKTPLTGIEMLAALIRDGVVGADRVPEITGRIIRRCREAIVQVTELLTLERVERGSPERHRQSGVAVRAAMHEVAARCRRQAETKELSFTVAVDVGDEVVAAVDERDFKDCMDNLLENAIKYTPKGGSVALSASLVGEEIRLSVKDSGMGIAKSSMDDIFEPFHRGNGALAANIAGSGLGLTIVREVVEQAHGSISANSVVDQGTEFKLSFPTMSATSRTDTPKTPRNESLGGTAEPRETNAP